MGNPARTNTTTVVSGQPVKDDGATVLYGGTADGNNVTQVKSADIVGYHSGKHGAVVPSPVTHGTDPRGVAAAIPGNAHATMTAGKYLGYKYTGTEQSNSALESGAGDFGNRRSIHFNGQRRSLLQVTAGWNYSTGAFLSTPSVQLDQFGHDDAAHPTRAIPGELQYSEHSPAYSGQGTSTFKLDDYKARTG